MRGGAEVPLMVFPTRESRAWVEGVGQRDDLRDRKLEQEVSVSFSIFS